MKPRYLVLAIGLLLCMAVPGASAAPLAVSVDTTVASGATTFAYQNNLVMLENGTLVCTYIDVDNNVTLRYSENSGANWSDPIGLDNETAFNESEVCSIYNETSGLVHVVYTQTNTSGSYVRYNYVDTDGWVNGTPANVSDPDYNQSQPYITIAPVYGDLIIVWIEQLPPTPNWNLMISFSDDDGSTWDEACDILTTGENQSWPCLAMDSNDTLHLTWSEENGTGHQWDYYYSRCEYPWTAFGLPYQVSEITDYNQTEGKVVILGPITIPDVGTGCAKGFFWNEQNGSDYYVHMTLGFAEENTTSNSSFIVSDTGRYVTASANATGFRAVWTDVTDEHLHQSFIAVDWDQLWDLDPSEWEDFEDLYDALSGIINYTLDEEIEIDLVYDTYYDWNASLMWYYDAGLNPIDKMVFTHGGSTHVVYYDFDDDFSTSEYQWVYDLTNSLIALMVPVLALVIIMSMFKGLGKSFKKIT